MNVRIEISARHVHLTQYDLEQLFGDGYELKKEKELSQPGQFASTDTVNLVGEKGTIKNVRVLGPCRQNTQVEVSKTDTFTLGTKAPVRLSGKIIGSGAIKLVGAKGELELTEGMIVAKRHLHVDLNQARELNVKNGQTIKVKIDGPRALIFDEIEVRVNEEYDEALHLDTDEGNAAGIGLESRGVII